MKLLFILIVIAGFGLSSIVFGVSGDQENPKSKITAQGEKNNSFEIEFDKIIQYKDLTIKFREIEDSRCPLDVTCVWEGQAKITLQVFQGSNELTITFVTGEKISADINQYKINLIDILPYPSSTTKNFEEDYVTTITILEEYQDLVLSSPLNQIKNGIPINDVTCGQEKIKVYKHNLVRLACVSQETGDKLVERGWALSKEKQSNLEISSLTSDIFIRSQYDNTEFDVQSKIINGQKFLIMQGNNWSYSQDIEIIIQSDSVKIKIIKTRTNNNGQFYISWLVPNYLQSGQYEVQITDGIKNKTEKITILGISNDIRQIGSGYQIIVEGDREIRRGTTHNIEVSVYKDQIPVQGAIIFLEIEDYGEDIIREFKGSTDSNGRFVYSWEIPKRFDDIETLLAFIGVVHGDFSRTELFKFVVYCLPGEVGCQVEGN